MLTEEIYLTPNLFIKNNITYYQDDDNNKLKIINANNWHKYLSEYGWEKLDNGWIRRLNKLKSEKKAKNSRWGLLDCGGEGNCLFNVIAEVLGEPYSLFIREKIAQEINEKNFDVIIENYRLAYDDNDFANPWNPYKIKSIDDLRKEIMKEGDNFWGDHITLQLLESAFDINIIVLNSEIEKKKLPLERRFTVHNIGNNYNPEKKTIILYYIDSIHFQLVGHFTETYMQTLFTRLPEELYMVYREDYRL